MFARNSFSLVVLLGILVFIAGCGPKLPGDLPKLYPTQIEVTATDGSKVENATVLLYPVGGTEVVGGTTNAQGIAEIRTRGEFSGAPAGKYKVCVNWSVLVEGPTSKRPAPTDPRELERYNRRVEDERTGRSALEPGYNDAARTPLEVEVVEGKNSLSVEVKKLDPLPTS